MKIASYGGLCSKHALRNSLEALLMADTNPDIDGLIIDVRLTKDNEVVIISEERIDSISNGKGYVSEMCLEELRKYRFSSRIKKMQIVTLKELLPKLSNNTLFIINVISNKQDELLVAEHVTILINKYPELKIVLKSKSPKTINILKNFTNRRVGIYIDQNNNVDDFMQNMELYSIDKKLINKNEFIDDIFKNGNFLIIGLIDNIGELNYIKKRLTYNIDNVYISSNKPLELKEET